MGKTKEYSNGEVTIVWNPEACIHSGICTRGLGEVFRPRERPWVKIDAATTDAMVQQVKACPSGALSYYMNNGQVQDRDLPAGETKIEVRENGPLLVHGALRVTHCDGHDEPRTRMTAFCRCGASSNKPFCDGTHKTIDFKG